jgi:hypothetical protein
MVELRLPSFVIIGAAKAATTWLSSNLEAHPAIFMPGPEPHFFSREFEKGASWYAEWFKAAGERRTVGEKSADYLAHPAAANRIRAVLPEARLIVQLRNPVERAYSDYCMLFRRGEVGSNPAHYLDASRAKQRRFLEDGLYGRHLARYFDAFPRDQMMCVLYDDIKRSPAHVYAGVCAHVGVDPVVASLSGARVKDKETPMLPLALRRLLRPLKRMVAPWRSEPWFRAGHELLSRPVRYPPLPRDLGDRLADYYADDVAALERLLGRDLSFWTARRDAQAA